MLDRRAGAYVIGVEGVFSDRSMLATQGITSGAVQFRREELRSIYWHYSPDGEVLDSAGVFFAAEVYNESTESVAIAMLAPFGREASIAVFGQRFYYASGQTYEIQVFNSAGSLERIIRRPVANRSVMRSDIQAFKEEFLQEPRLEVWARRRLNDLEFPETMPAFGSVKVDALGCIWVAEYSLGREDREGRWTVFDTDGRMLGVVEVPRGGILTDIGKDYLIGRWRTDLDVEQVRMYRLIRD